MDNLNSEKESEFRGRKLLIFASALGLSTGVTATMFYSLGAFIPPLEREFGWDRGNISLAVTFLTVGLFLSGPFVGKLCDVIGAAKVGALSLLFYAVVIATLPIYVESILVFWVVYFLIAVIGAGSTPIVLVRPVSTLFDKHRGLALGIALTGAGLAGFWVPNLVSYVTASAGWRAAYVMLAATALVAAPVVWIGFRHAETGQSVVQSNVSTGLSAKEARGTLIYWLMTLMALSMALGIAGVVVHLIPFLTDLGDSAANAAQTASIIGLSSVVGRIAVGLMLDRFGATTVSMAILTLAAIGIVLLWLTGLQFAIIAVIFLGFAAGAEIDLLAYLTARFFGRRSYGAIYGWQYSVFALGYGFSPFLVGRLRDYFGSYDIPFLASATSMLIAAAVALMIGRAHRGNPEHAH
tara:strand:- start:3078 stop:4304 length:1227 start_codon:yes stop_codon:yes gene_type:complete